MWGSLTPAHLAFANRQVARRGGDPTATVQQSRLPTFRTACERVEAAATWKGARAKNRRSALERYCGSILARRLDQIRRADVIAILTPVLAEKPATGEKLHGWIRAGLAWGLAREYLEYNVADGIGAALPSVRKAKKHHAALPYSEVGPALDAIATSRRTRRSRRVFDSRYSPRLAPERRGGRSGARSICRVRNGASRPSA